MSFDDLVTALRESSEDRHVSRGERKVLRALLEEHGLDQREARLLRAKAYALAREALDAPRAHEILDWLEDVVGLLLHATRTTSVRPVEAEAHFSPGHDCLGAVVEELRRVRARADICVFTITDDRITDGILSAARRGVALRVVTDDEKARDKGSDVDLLTRHGVAVAMDRSADHMHHKFAIFDDLRLLTGSFNWTRSASRGNNENLLITTEPRLVSAYAEEFERLWASYAR